MAPSTMSGPERGACGLIAAGRRAPWAASQCLLDISSPSGALHERPKPVLIDDRRYLLFRERAHLAQEVLVRRADQLRDLVEITVPRATQRIGGRALWPGASRLVLLALAERAGD